MKIPSFKKPGVLALAIGMIVCLIVTAGMTISMAVKYPAYKLSFQDLLEKAEFVNYSVQEDGHILAVTIDPMIVIPLPEDHNDVKAISVELTETDTYYSYWAQWFLYDDTEWVISDFWVRDGISTTILSGDDRTEDFDYLRVDPCNIEGESIRLESITVNPVSAFLNRGFAFGLLFGACACLLSLLVYGKGLRSKRLPVRAVPAPEGPVPLPTSSEHGGRGRPLLRRQALGFVDERENANMPQKEKVFVEWICDHIYVIFAVGATIVSIIIRISMRHYTSDDMTGCLLPWFETILNHGGLNALGTQVGNYNMPYQSLIAVMTYIPLNPQYLYKISSCAFDYIIGFFAAQVTYDITKNIGKSIATYGMLINLPIVLFNSALWGQCDSIYSAFCLISLYLIFKKEYTLSFIAYGISMAFKLQAIFLLPFLIYVYIHKKEFSVSKFLWIPLMMIVLSLGGILQGQPIVRVFGIYLEQAHDRAMSVNYPSFWALMMENWPETDEFIHDMKVYAIMLAVLVPGAMFTVLLHIKKRSLSDGELLKIAFLSVYAIVFLLPNMHERYGYLYIIFGFIVSIIDKKTTLIYVFLLSIDIVIYSHYLFGIEVQWQVLAMGNLICFAVYSYYILSSVLREQRCFEK